MIRVLFFLAALLASPAALAQAPQVQIVCDTGNAAPNQWQPCDTNNTFPISLTSQYPSGSTPITGNATGTTGAVVGSLAGTAGKTTYICGLNVSATGGTAAIGPITVANTITGSMAFELNSSVAGTNISENFSPCIPANAANTAITTTTTADGTASAVAVNSWGFQK